ncbi:MAG: hypothetical protein NWR72_15755 [Bacteroidia bacterium]|nr:hypothetical protein [Bacteroidia bacterium]
MPRPITLAFSVGMLFLSATLLTSCESAEEKTRNSASDNTLRDLPVAVASPPQAERRMNDFKDTEVKELGFPLSMALPEDVIIKRDDALGGWLLFNPSEEFKLVAEPSMLSLEEIIRYWQGNPEGYVFRNMIINSENGILFEVEHNDKIEYHIDFVFEGLEHLRLYNAKDRPFSEYQATRMFHTCRTAKSPVAR